MVGSPLSVVSSLCIGDLLVKLNALPVEALVPSPQPENALKSLVVVGAGALGLVLAQDLALSFGTSADVRVFSRRLPPEPWLVSSCDTNLLPRLGPSDNSSKAVPLVPLQVPLQAWDDASGVHPDNHPDVQKIVIQENATQEFKGVSSRVVFFCVPPTQVEASFVQAAQQGLFAAHSCAHLQVVVCTNGILEPEVATRLRSLRPDAQLIRALFFAGFMREQSDKTGTRAIHTGGNLVRFGNLNSGNLNSCERNLGDPKKTLEPDGLFAEVVAHNGLLNWQKDANILRVEAEKFFTNVMLAMHIGPNKLPNGHLRALLPAAKAATWARVFASLFPDRLLEPALLCERLWATVDATRANVNSVSFAGSEGDDSTARMFLEQLEKRTLVTGSKHAILSLRSLAALWSGTP